MTVSHCLGLWWVPNFGDFYVFTFLICFKHWLCFTHFAPWVPYHILLMHLICTPHAHLIHTLDHLTCFAFHSCYVSLVRPLALKTWSCDFVCLSLFFLGLFVRFWTNLYLIKFVFLFVFVFVSLCWCLFCRCLLLRKTPKKSLLSVPAPPRIHFAMMMLTWLFLVTINGP